MPVKAKAKAYQVFLPFLLKNIAHNVIKPNNEVMMMVKGELWVLESSTREPSPHNMAVDV